MTARLVANGGTKTLVVDGRPYVVLGGEVHNSTGSSPRLLAQAMDRAVALGMNTVLVAVTWELVEPVEGRFDFGTVDAMIDLARQRGLHLGLLWFGAWKNGACSYAPEWVKRDLGRFRRAEGEPGRRKAYLDFHGMTLPFTTLSAVCEATRAADACAFAQVMAHLRQVDEAVGTVVMVQVENEVGLLGAVRERSAEADALFAGQVPQVLVDFMRAHQDTLAPDVRAALQAGSGQGSWEEVFGPVAEELFQAWCDASYVEAVARAGRQAYDLPAYVNCWLDKGKAPGKFPTGGPVARAMEVWKVAAPSVQMVAPDIYVPDFCGVIDTYQKLCNPTIVVETAIHGHVATRAVWTICHAHAVCFSPFAFEDMGEPFDDSAGVLFGASPDPAASTPQDPEEYGSTLRALHQLLGYAMARDALGSMDAAISERPQADALPVGTSGACQLQVSYRDKVPGAVAVVPAGPEEAYVLAMHCGLDFVSANSARPHVDILALEEGSLVAGPEPAGTPVWRRDVRLNGDEATMVWFDQPTLLRVELLSYA